MAAGGGGAARAPDRLKHRLAGAERQAELAQVVRGQLRQNLGVDLFVEERLRVAPQAQYAQPSLDVHPSPSNGRAGLRGCNLSRAVPY